MCAGQRASIFAELRLGGCESLTQCLSLLAQGAEFYLDGFALGQLDRRHEFKFAVAEAGCPPVPIHRCGQVTLDTQTTLVQIAEVNLRARVALGRGFVVPVTCQCVVGDDAEALFVNFTDIDHRIRVAFFRFWQPDLQCSGVVGAIVGDVLTAADFAIGAGGFDGAARREVSEPLSQFTNLGRQHTVDYHELVGIAQLCRRVVR